MIARLVGTLVDHSGTTGIVDVGGVGYEILAPARAFATWVQQPEPVVVHVSTQVREDAITLYGFTSPRDRVAFQALLGVSGIGPKTALAALDTFEVDALCQAVETDDVRALSSISGVGRKSAQRMALELKGKIPADFTPVQGGARRATGPKAPADMLPLALARLDYGKSEIDRALRALEAQGIGPDRPVEERLRAALQVLAGSR